MKPRRSGFVNKIQMFLAFHAEPPPLGAGAVLRAMLAAAFAAAAVVSLGPTAQARCNPGQTGSRDSADSSPSLDTILMRVQQRYDCSRSFQANFVETLSSPGGMTRTRKGTVYFKKVGRMRWEFGAPSVGTVVSDGKTVYDYEQDLNQVVELPVSKALKSNATAFLLGLGNIRRDFKAALPPGPSRDGLTHIILTPKGGGDTMELGLDPKSYDIINFKLTSQIGGVTELKFSDIQTNVALNDSLFSFRIPDGADIVRPQRN